MSTIPSMLDRHSGIESLTVGERIKLFASEISTGLTSINIKIFGDSVHVVDPGITFSRLKEKNNYFQLSTDFIPAPLFFDPKKMSFKDYITICTNLVGLMKVTTDAIDEVYKGLKTAAVTGNVPFSIRKSSHEVLLTDLATKLDMVFENTGKATRQLSVLYANYSEAEDIFRRYNETVKSINHRDAELLVSRVTNLTELVKIFRRKIEENDIVIKPEDLVTIEIALKRVDNMVRYCGRLMTMCNELTRVFELQLNYFKQK